MTTPHFRLEVLEGEPHGATLDLDGHDVVLGREPDCALVLGGPGISRHHCRLARSDAGWTVEDLGSTNGVRVGADTVRRRALVAGDVLTVGSVRLLFRETVGADGARPGAPAAAPSAAPPHGTAHPPTTAPRAPVAPRPVPADDPEADAAAVGRLKAARERVLTEISKVIVGQRAVVDLLLTALFARGHCLVVGVPGLAKTRMVRALSSLLDLDGKRIQFTPDLMPSDVTGTEILEEDPADRRRTFRFVPGPVFTNVLLADEINRTPPKTQSALLEAMQEHRVTVAGRTYDLPQPFFVLATQNPVEQEGTYPLPEAQLDRFLFEVRIDYPDREDEIEIYRTTTTDEEPALGKVLSAREILDLQRTVRRIPVSEHVAAYAADLVRATRPKDPAAPAFVKDWVSWGAGPRAGQGLLLAAKARAALSGRFHATADDVRAAALPVLRHRVFLSFGAASEGVVPDTVVRRLLETVKEPAPEAYRGKGAPAR